MPAITDRLLSQGNIMVVDDNPANLKLLRDMLGKRNYEVRAFPRGRLALAAAEQEPPDLILLDTSMPEMDGYQVCEQLKSDESLAGIPVMFISALNAVEDQVKAFRSGGVDYISKPFQFDEVNARVETQLELYKLRRASKLQNERLEAAVAVRTRALSEATERLTILDRSKSDLLNIISHELRTPLHIVFGVGELVLEQIESSEENQKLQEMFEKSRERILSVVNDALLLTEIDASGERVRCGPVSLSVVLNRAIENVGEFARSRHVLLGPPPAGMGFVDGDEGLLVRALQALLEIAVEFSEKSKTVCLMGEAGPESARVVIESEGRTIPNAALATFFDLCSIFEAITPGRDLGLRAPVAYRILELIGAAVSVTSRDDSTGVRFTILLRTAPVEGASRL